MDGAAAQLVKEAHAGLVVPPEKPKELANAIRVLGDMPLAQRAEMGRLGREYLIANLSKGKVIPKYETILKQAMMSHLKK